MSIEKLVVVGGISGIHKVVANRSNGLIIENLDTGKRRFAPSRKYQFTPLESITIYTDDDGETLELSKVFQDMFTKLEEIPLVELNAPNDELKAYFAEIIPNYDRERVFIGDMKKMIKWFKFLNDRSIITLEEEEEETPEGTETKEVASENVEKKEVNPKIEEEGTPEGIETKEAAPENVEKQEVNPETEKKEETPKITPSE